MGDNNKCLTLVDAELGIEYEVKGIQTDDEELNSFLFTLGCYAGEPIVVVSHISSGYVVAIKDGRYNINADLASAIQI
ncbi:MAG: ferrous iron transport protein A [Eubacteriales bacterium]